MSIEVHASQGYSQVVDHFPRQAPIHNLKSVQVHMVSANLNSGAVHYRRDGDRMPSASKMKGTYYYFPQVIPRQVAYGDEH